MATEKYNVVILGSGPAGLTAAIYTARAGLKPLVIGGAEPGGQLMLTTEVENFPGFKDGIQGPELMQQMRAQATRFGATIWDANITEADLAKRPYKLKAGDKEVEAESIIIATGASARWLGLDSEKKLIGKGVSSCATCDGFFFKDKELIVIGGGDAAMEEANFLTKFASKVTVIVRRDVLRASKIMQKRAKENKKIEFIWNSEVQEVLGKDKVEGVMLKNNKTGKDTKFKTDGMFVAIGHKPNTEFIEGQVELDKKKYVSVTDNTHTSKEGVFVAGDVQDYRYRQAITASGLGCMAALDAEKWLVENGISEGSTSSSYGT